MVSNRPSFNKTCIKIGSEDHFSVLVLYQHSLQSLLSSRLGQLFEMHAVAVVSCSAASVCSCNHSCSCGCLQPSFLVVLAVVSGLRPPFVLAVAVVDAFCSAVAVVLAVVPSYNPTFAVCVCSCSWLEP